MAAVELVFEEIFREGVVAGLGPAADVGRLVVYP